VDLFMTDFCYCFFWVTVADQLCAEPSRLGI
jgi:hypothetical protein